MMYIFDLSQYYIIKKKNETQQSEGHFGETVYEGISTVNLLLILLLYLIQYLITSIIRSQVIQMYHI
ncbi:hypothetical protein TorRG33x02_158100 [Trema orientale]|uniref:Uncharacterized protein n=1 Tax=Trema orientale TaxID=63057 RepID=A0A2P5ESC3_TREOI|nr:hypothetical protein TorRG33x02_158100 [Trema orientale]